MLTRSIQILDEFSLRCARLSGAGFLPAELPLAALPRHVADLAEATDFPVFPESWVEGAPPDLARRILALAESVRGWASERAQSPELREAAWTTNLDALCEAVSSAALDAQHVLKAPRHVSLRQLLAILEEVDSPLSTLLERVEDVQARLEDFSHALNHPLPASTAWVIVERLVELGRIVGEQETSAWGGSTTSCRDTLLRKSSAWQQAEARLDEEQRAFLARFRPEALAADVSPLLEDLKAFAEGSVEGALEAHSELHRRFHPVAFSTEGLVRASEALHFRGALSRLFGSWKAVRSRVAELYATIPPVAVPQILADMDALRTFHEAHQKVWESWERFRARLQPLYATDIPAATTAVVNDLKVLQHFQSSAGRSGRNFSRSSRTCPGPRTAGSCGLEYRKDCRRSSAFVGWGSAFRNDCGMFSARPE